jgi:hypothetical protein
MPDASVLADSTLTLTMFSTGLTALAKKLGVSGEWLIVVCVLAGGMYSYLTTYQPSLFSALSGVILAATASGNVFLLKDLAQTMGKPSGN